MYVNKHLGVCHMPRDLPQGNNDADARPLNARRKEYSVPDGILLRWALLAGPTRCARGTQKIGIEGRSGIGGRLLLIVVN
jgi:hypothetical protein